MLSLSFYVSAESNFAPKQAGLGLPANGKLLFDFPKENKRFDAFLLKINFNEIPCIFQVHVCLLVCEARFQAGLLYALRAFAEYYSTK